MAQGFYRQVIQQLSLLGFQRIKGGKGSHEKWISAARDKTLIVPRPLKSRHTANNIFEDRRLRRTPLRSTNRPASDTPMEYTVIAADNYSAYVPDLPGCVAAADTPEEVLELMKDAIEFHLEGLRRDGGPIPAPQTTAAQVHVAA